MDKKEQILIEIVRLNTLERSIEYLIYHFQTCGFSSKETTREILKLLMEKLEEQTDE